MDYLDLRGLCGNSTDVTVDGGVCGLERPDRVYDFGDKIVILECDEDQHRYRKCDCEQARMVNIGQSFGGTPVCFVRWNPDDYSPENHRSGVVLVPQRHKLCGDLIRDIRCGKHKPPTALVSVIYLYFDGWNGLHNEKWSVLHAFEIDGVLSNMEKSSTV
jgi:hypothetical protein